jgi:nucleotide-binding universal stress UspA family protein
MGTHGQGTLADAMLGSTAQRVLRRSPVPVLVVRLPN